LSFVKYKECKNALLYVLPIIVKTCKTRAENVKKVAKYPKNDISCKCVKERKKEFKKKKIYIFFSILDVGILLSSLANPVTLKC
jgi:hypothetical protein